MWNSISYHSLPNNARQQWQNQRCIEPKRIQDIWVIVELSWDGDQEEDDREDDHVENIDYYHLDLVQLLLPHQDFLDCHHSFMNVFSNIIDMNMTGRVKQSHHWV